MTAIHWRIITLALAPSVGSFRPSLCNTISCSGQLLRSSRWYYREKCQLVSEGLTMMRPHTSVYKVEILGQVVLRMCSPLSCRKGFCIGLF